MNVDAIILGLIAIADLGLLVELRMRRSRKLQRERVARSLQQAIRRESTWTEAAPKRGLLRRAS